jgi:hypothetical protein
MGVRLEFESIRSRLLHSSTLTIAHALSDLFTKETRLRSMSISHMTLPHNVWAAYHGGSNPMITLQILVCTVRRLIIDVDCFIKYLEKLAAFHACRVAHGCGPPLPSGVSMAVVIVSPAASSLPQPPSTSASGLPPGNPGWFWPSGPP